MTNFALIKPNHLHANLSALPAQNQFCLRNLSETLAARWRASHSLLTLLCLFAPFNAWAIGQSGDVAPFPRPSECACPALQRAVLFGDFPLPPPKDAPKPTPKPKPETAPPCPNTPTQTPAPTHVPTPAPSVTPAPKQSKLV